MIFPSRGYRCCLVYYAFLQAGAGMAQSICSNAPLTCDLTSAQSQQSCRCEYVWDGSCAVSSELNCKAPSQQPSQPPSQLPFHPPPTQPPSPWCGASVCTDCFGPANVAVIGSGPPPPYQASGCPAGGLPPTRFDYAGPFWKAGAPIFQAGVVADILEPGDGPELILNLSVVDPDCQPIASAKVDLWHTSGAGYYGDELYALTGNSVDRFKYTAVLFTDASGHATLKTVVPTRPPSRPICHIHVHYSRPGSSARYTTQIYFPGATGNAARFSANGATEIARITGRDARQNLRAEYQFVIPHASG